MRKYTVLEEKINDICKIMIYDSPEQTYVFLYDTTKDAACFADYWFESLEEAEEYCKDLGINDVKWHFIDDPIDACPHDIIQGENSRL